MIEKKIEEKLKKALQDPKIFLQDMTGTNDHFNAIIISDDFIGKNLIAVSYTHLPLPTKRIV